MPTSKQATVSLASKLREPNVDLSQHLRQPRAATTQEWVPVWLRKSRLLPLTFFCLLLAGALQALDVLIKSNNGISTQNVHAIRAVRYTPTIAVIILGLFWKAVCSDAKKIMPWSTLSQSWTKSSHSVLLDYVTSIEFLGLIPAVRRGHGAVFVGIVFGFVCGGLVALANSLTFIDLSASSRSAATLKRTTTFRFDNALESQSPSGNHSLTIFSNPNGQQPYAAAAAAGLPNGHFAPWTTNNWTFESFQGDDDLGSDSLLEAVVQGVSPGWNCGQLTYRLFDGLVYSADGSALNCSIPIRQSAHGLLLNVLEPQPYAYLNITNCSRDPALVGLSQQNAIDTSTDDIRFLVTLVVPVVVDISSFDYLVSKDVVSIIGVMCKTDFTSREAKVRVNATSRQVVDHLWIQDIGSSISIKTSTEALYMYLNNPLDGRLADAYASTDGSSFTDKLPTTQFQDVLGYVDRFGGSAASDPFVSFMTNGQLKINFHNYIQDPAQWLAEAEQSGNRILTQVVNSFTRANDTKILNGTVWTQEPKMFLRQISLRYLQALLVSLGIACSLQATWLRPRTVLKEDPGPIATTALLLATSSGQIDAIFAHESVSAAEHIQHKLRLHLWRLQPTVNGALSLIFVRKNAHLAEAVQPLASRIHRNSGYRPVPLRLWSRLGISAVFIMTIVSLAVLQNRSVAWHGLALNTSINSNLFAFVPTVVLLLLSYACSGVDGAVKLMAPFHSLWKHDSKKLPLLLNMRDYPGSWMSIRAIVNGLGFTVFASSFAIFLIPAAKIAAAGLYTADFAEMAEDISVDLNISLMDNLENAFSLTDSELSVQRASQFTEWALTGTSGVPARSGILDNLVFGELVNQTRKYTASELVGAEIAVNVPAIQVDVTCLPVNLGVSVKVAPCQASKYTSRGFQWIAQSECSAADCRRLLKLYTNATDVALNLKMVSATSTGNDASCSIASNRFQGKSFRKYMGAYQVVLADFASVQGPMHNSNFVDTALQSVPFSALKFNVSIPNVLATTCSRNLSKVWVDAVFTLNTQSIADGGLVTALWSPKRYNRSTIRQHSQYDSLKIPYWAAPAAIANYDEQVNIGDNRTNSHGQIDSPTLWPNVSSSANIFQLLATYSTHVADDVESLLDRDQFIKAVEAVYTTYATEILTELRTMASANASSAVKSVSTAATIRYRQSRIMQNKASTVLIEILLTTMFLCFLRVFCRLSSENILPKNPGSIAVRLSLLANSELVSRLRQEGAVRVRDTRIWYENTGLGWWPSSQTLGMRGMDSNGMQNDQVATLQDTGLDPGNATSRGLRFGIDFGSNVIRRSWKWSQPTKPSQ